MKKKKAALKTKRQREPIQPAMHYSIMLALMISIVTSLGLAFLMAQVMGMSMGNIAEIGEHQRIAAAQAQVRTTLRSSAGLPGSGPVQLPEPIGQCEARWAVCSQACDDSYSEGNFTRVGWNTCERDCDLKIMRCERTGSWSETIQLRDVRFVPN